MSDINLFLSVFVTFFALPIIGPIVTLLPYSRDIPHRRVVFVGSLLPAIVGVGMWVNEVLLDGYISSFQMYAGHDLETFLVFSPFILGALVALYYIGTGLYYIVRSMFSIRRKIYLCGVLILVAFEIVWMTILFWLITHYCFAGACA